MAKLRNVLREPTPEEERRYQALVYHDRPLRTEAEWTQRRVRNSLYAVGWIVAACAAVIVVGFPWNFLVALPFLLVRPNFEQIFKPYARYRAEWAQVNGPSAQV